MTEKKYWRLWCSAMLRIVEERSGYLHHEMMDTDSENLNGQYMATAFLVQRLRVVLHEAEKGAQSFPEHPDPEHPYALCEVCLQIVEREMKEEEDLRRAEAAEFARERLNSPGYEA